MKIKFEGEYKSLSSFESDELADFTVITGENGSGKTQLIKLFSMTLNNEIPKTLKFNTIPPLISLQVEGFLKSGLHAQNNDAWKTKIQGFYSSYKGIGENSIKLLDLMIKSGLETEKIDKNTIYQVTDQTDEAKRNLDNLINVAILENLKGKRNILNSNFESLKKDLSRYKSIFKISKFVAANRFKSIYELSEADFFNTTLPENYLDVPDLFKSEISNVFFLYAKRRYINKNQYASKITENEENNSLSIDEFERKFIPPWISINSIMEKYGIKYRFKGIENKDFSLEANFPFPLIKNDSKIEVDYSDLSTGELIIVGLIIKLFTSKYYKDKLLMPELLVLDEPDAFLHPSMTKLLIDVLSNTFVNDLGIKVIMTTHSATTVALSPEDSIYELKNTHGTSLKKIDKNDALKVLTGSIPTLSIDYLNHKQVFVESLTDVNYYQMIFDLLNKNKKYPYKFYFISNSNGKGNCEQVINIVKCIRESGNKTSYGIIDNDLKNVTTEFVKVHGSRYSIENYLYDPIFIVVLLMHMKAHNVLSDLGYVDTFNYYLIGNEPYKKLQEVSDWFFGKMKEKYPAKFTKNDTIAIEYYNGKIIDVPKWFVEDKGHDIEIMIKNVFSALGNKYRNEGEMQREIIPFDR